MSTAERRHAVQEICRRGIPLVIPDTCSLFDIVRAPVREAFRQQDATFLRWLAKTVDAGTPGVTVALTEQVGIELGDNLAGVLEETQDKLEQASAIVAAMLSRMGWLAEVDPDAALELHGRGHPEIGKDIMDRLVASAQPVPDCDDSKLAAATRVSLAVAPSQRAKQSFKDCLVAETALRLASECRAAGHAERIVFFSANREDYCTGTRLELRRPLDQQFAAVDMEFQSRWSALHQLVPRLPDPGSASA